MAESTFLTLGAMAFSPSVEVDFDVSKKVSLRLMEMEKLIIEERVLEAGTARSFTLMKMIESQDQRVPNFTQSRTLDKWGTCRVAGNIWRQGQEQMAKTEVSRGSQRACFVTDKR